MTNSLLADLRPAQLWTLKSKKASTILRPRPAANGQHFPYQDSGLETLRAFPSKRLPNRVSLEVIPKSDLNIQPVTAKNERPIQAERVSVFISWPSLRAKEEGSIQIALGSKYRKAWGLTFLVF